MGVVARILEVVGKVGSDEYFLRKVSDGEISENQWVVELFTIAHTH